MRLRKYNTSIVAAGSMTGTAVISATPVKLQGPCSGLNIQAVISTSAGPVTGTAILQASNDDVPPGQATNWTTVDGSSQPVSGNGSLMWDYPTPSFTHFQLIYTNASGTGTLNARASYTVAI